MSLERGCEEDRLEPIELASPILETKALCVRRI
jgi:hypothetical protein